MIFNTEIAVCERYEIEPEDLYKRTRKRKICEARQICAVFFYGIYPQVSLQTAATWYCLTNHSTVLLARYKLYGLYKVDPYFRQLLQDIHSEISAIRQIPSLNEILTSKHRKWAA